MAYMETLETLVWVFSGLLTIYGLYFMLMGIFTFMPLKERKTYDPKHRFGIIIAARNEEVVIGELVDSLKKQTYPDELYDIIVVPNNCTDHTKSVALDHGASVYEPKTVIRSKGDVLKEVFAHLLRGKKAYDAYLVFDADNLVDENFISEMNNALIDGAEVAQGYRDSKNPYDNYMTNCTSIYYYLVNRLFNRPRNSIGMSGMVNGTGFMVKVSLLREMGGYITETMTEDIEFSAQVILRGKKITWVPQAIIYDEQPDTFDASWKQRMRWSIGLIQCNKRYLGELIKGLGKKNWFQHFDYIMFFISPFVQIASIISGIFILFLNLLYIQYSILTLATVASNVMISIFASYAATSVGSMFILKLEKKNLFKSIKGILTFALFLTSWVPINIISMVKPDTTWHEIKHNRKVAINRKI